MKKGIDYIGVGVCFMCHDGKGNFLFTKRGEKARDEKGKWEVPAGGVEIGESLDEAVRRELKEELCVEPKVIEYVGHREFIKESEGETRHWIHFSYLIEVDPKGVSIGEPDMCAEITWATFEKLPQPMHPSMLDCVTLIQNYIHAKTDLL